MLILGGLVSVRFGVVMLRTVKDIFRLPVASGCAAKTIE